MEDKIFLLVRVIIRTTHPQIHEAIAELQQGTHLTLTSTPNVEVVKTEIMQLKNSTSKN